MRYLSFLSPGSSAPLTPPPTRLYEEGKFPVDRIAKTFKVEQFDEAVAAM